MKQKGFAPLLILILIALATLGYFGYKYFQSTNKVPAVTVSSPIPSVNPAVGWKTYTSTKDGFSFKYPEDFKMVKPFQPFYTLDTPIVMFLSSKADYQTQGYVQESTIAVSTQSNLASCFGINDPTATVNGTTFYIENVPGGAAAGSTYTTTLYRTQMGEECFEIAFTVHVGSDWVSADPAKSVLSVESAKLMFNQILSTFTFTK